MTNLLSPRLPGNGEVVYLASSDVTGPATERLIARISERLPCIVGLDAFAAQRDHVWGIINWASSNLHASILAHGVPASLAWLHQSGVGMEAIASLPIPSAVTVTSIKGNSYYAVPMAEHVVARMLEWTKRLPYLWQEQDQRLWRQFDAATLAGKTVMIFGAGAIGRAVASRLAAFEMRIIMVRCDPATPVDGFETIGLPDALQRLAEADYIVLTMPLTAATRSVIGAPELRRLKPRAFIVNVGRAALVDEAALAAALRAGQLGGIAFDVFWREPLEAGDDVWTWPHTAITPHMSANIEGGNTDLIIDTAIATLDCLRAGQITANRVDLAAGY